MEPYINARVYQNWRWNYNTGGGQLLDWIGHHGDIAHWGLGFDFSGPSEVQGFGEFPPANAVWNVALKYTVECTYRKEVTGYSNDVSVTIAGGSPAISMGTEMDWHRRLGLGRPQRLRRLQPCVGQDGFPARCAAQNSAL